MKKMVIVFLHIGYWLLYLILLFIIMMCLYIGSQFRTSPFFLDIRFEIFFSAFAIFPAVLGFYSFYNFLFDRFLLRRNILLLFVLGITFSYIISFISAALISVLHIFNIGPSIFGNKLSAVVSIMTIIAIIAVLNGGMGLLVKGFIRWYGDLKLKEELLTKNFEMELALIKSQISPHFLFNTLNNIDVLITKNAVKASVYLNKLSDIMRFMLYETKSEKVDLEKEIAYIEKYIDLQRIRRANPNFVEFIMAGETGGKQISPMILLPFIENAFKHADNKKNEHIIRIRIETDTHLLIFECENKYSDSALKQEFSGLGNELIKRRLALLYPDKHTLLINKNAEIYYVKLIIHIDEN